jgi:signal transduction histidine kinase
MTRHLRLVLGLAFGALLALMLLAGMYALGVLRQMHAEEERAQENFLQRSRSLSTLCSTIEIYTDRVQTYLLRPAPPEPDDLDRIAAEIESAMRSYPASRGGAERDLLDTVDQLMQRQQHLLRSMLSLDPAARRHAGPRIVIEELIPMRTRVVDCSVRLGLWNAQQVGESTRALLARIGQLQHNLARLLIVALGSGLLLAIGSIFYIGGLERQGQRRYQELQRLSAKLVDAQESERRAISRELHDEVGQSLGALLVDLGRLSATAPPEVKEELGRMKGVAESAVATVRNIALLLRPSMLDDLGLVPALEWQAREMSRRGEMEVEVRSQDIPEDLPDEYKVCIYRLVQEALHNAARHAGAKNASVDVRREGGAVTVTVHDDGRGFDPTRTRGLGLLGMEERVKRLDGRFKIDAAPGRGATISAELPLPPGERA